MAPRLSEKQTDALRAIRDGRLTSVRMDGAGVFSVDGFHHNTVLSLIERELIDMEQDDQRFWKYHLSLTETGLSALVDNSSP